MTLPGFGGVTSASGQALGRSPLLKYCRPPGRDPTKSPDLIEYLADFLGKRRGGPFPYRHEVRLRLVPGPRESPSAILRDAIDILRRETGPAIAVGGFFRLWLVVCRYFRTAYVSHLMPLMDLLLDFSQEKQETCQGCR